MRISKGTKTISLDWGQNGGYGSLKLTSDGTFGYLAFLIDNPTFASQIKIGDVIQISQAGNNIGSGTVLGPYETFSNTTVESPHQDWTGIKGFKLSNNYELASGFPADLNIDGFIVTLQRGVTITGKQGRITSLVGFDNISTIPDGTYALVDNATGTGGTVTMSSGAIASFTPGSGYSLGDVYAEGYGNRFTVASIGPSGLRITGIGGTGGGLFAPTGSPSEYFGGIADFEMGVWSSGDSGTVPDISGSNHTLGLNDSTYSGSVDYYRFYNNSAQANDPTWPMNGTSTLAIMGWFSFETFGGSTSIVTQNNGGGGWSLRIDGSGSEINLVKYNVADQRITLDTTLTTNQWHFISVCQDVEAMDFVIDGTRYTLTGSATPFSNDGAPVRLQYDSYVSGDQNVKMSMRDVKIVSSIPLSYADLMQVWSTTKANYGY
jgi:hypothetical protein